MAIINLISMVIRHLYGQLVNHYDPPEIADINDNQSKNALINAHNGKEWQRMVVLITMTA